VSNENLGGSVDALPSINNGGRYIRRAIVVISATAQKRYDPGASDTEIKIGNTMPYSGF